MKDSVATNSRRIGSGTNWWLVEFITPLIIHSLDVGLHARTNVARRVEVTVTEFVLIVKVVSDLALAKGSEDGEVLLHGEL
ncbi:MAG: hypothetical protein ACYCPT_12115 [Acidimicrobiales bacterium]